MFRNFCRSFRNISIIVKSPRNALVPQTRSHATKVFRVARAQAEKGEPLEAIKWVLLVIPVTSFGLGCWQIHRLRWKLDLIDRLHATTNAAPVDMPMDFTELESMEYRPVRVCGQFLHDKEILIGPRALIEESQHFGGSLVSDPKKNQGWLVITPFILKDRNEVILVNRGWIPSSLRARAARAASAVPGEIELTGVVRLTEKRAPFMPSNNPGKGSWFSRDLPEMASHLGCSPVWLDARGIRDPPEGWPIPNQTRVTLRNEHVGYIVTWFSLSAFTSFMWHRHFIRKLPLL